MLFYLNPLPVKIRYRFLFSKIPSFSSPLYFLQQYKPSNMSSVTIVAGVLLVVGLSSLLTTFVSSMLGMASVTLSFWIVVLSGFICASSSSFNPDLSRLISPEPRPQQSEWHGGGERRSWARNLSLLSCYVVPSNIARGFLQRSSMFCVYTCALPMRLVTGEIFNTIIYYWFVKKLARCREHNYLNVCIEMRRFLVIK